MGADIVKRGVIGVTSRCSSCGALFKAEQIKELKRRQNVRFGKNKETTRYCSYCGGIVLPYDTE